jgi:hypothetical protein
MSTNPKEITAQEGSVLMDKFNEMQAKLDRQAELIAKQQAVLTSPEFLTRTQPEQAPAEPKKLETVQDVLDHVNELVAQKIDASMDQLTSQLVPLVRKATPEAEVWSKTDEAEKIVAENPALSMDMALELAEVRIQKRETEQKALQEEAAQVEAHKLALDASLAGKSGPSTPGPTGSGKSFQESYERNWQKAGMDAALSELERQVDDVWAQQSTNVQVSLD